MTVNDFFPDLGLGTLARIARIACDDPGIDKRFAQNALGNRRHWERTNPLLRNAARRKATD